MLKSKMFNRNKMSKYKFLVFKMTFILIIDKGTIFFFSEKVGVKKE